MSRKKSAAVVEEPAEETTSAGMERRLRMAEAIREIRGSMSQQDLSDLILAATGYVIPQTTVSRYERAMVDMTYEHVWAIETALQVPYGTVGRRVGFIDDSNMQMGSLEDICAQHPSLHPDVRPGVVASMKTWIRISRRLTIADSGTGARARVRYADGDVANVR